MLEQPSDHAVQRQHHAWILNRRRRRLLGRLFLAALLPLSVFALFTVVQKSVQSYRVQHQAAMIYAEIEAEREENINLQRELNLARSDAGIEDAARRHLGLVNSGDHPVVLIGNLPRATPTPRAEAVRPPDDPIPSWLEALLSRVGL